LIATRRDQYARAANQIIDYCARSMELCALKTQETRPVVNRARFFFVKNA
jgi:hypothetical protein